MTIREWNIETPIRHDLRLEHGWGSGSVKLFVDEKVVYERPVTLIDYGFQHEIILDGTAYVVSVRPRNFGFIYSFERSELASSLVPPPVRISYFLIPFFGFCLMIVPIVVGGILLLLIWYLDRNMGPLSLRTQSNLVSFYQTWWGTAQCIGWVFYAVGFAIMLIGWFLADLRCRQITAMHRTRS
jgi:hypothetical protein